ncbi:MAG: sn-glycerol-3-phosphate ABC transporter ATP-binding protein UgpC [Rhodospirillales bacterium 20-60-12]|nr:MAG: sn-glycerol-3-phosphate ABC transporter ATP-binding protein UgpC [Rhodospirillales bacterium 20-60-12]HQT67102.1 sn-glycerol-3-phosphate ABC transporter ATP-binding protein UgpC [Acetobacteraceae bacterium]
MAVLELHGLRKEFAGQTILHGLDLRLDDGEMLVIVGASGCGKSTLLRLIAGLELPSGGQIMLDGAQITERDPAARDIAMVFQNYALYPHMSVFQNMAYGLKLRHQSKEEINRRVTEAAELLGITPLLARKPRELSGGQRQRVAMGRAIVREPKLFLFDEPLSNLDARLRVQMRGEIRRLQQRLGITSLYVTHDQVEAMTMADRLIVMHQGVAAQIATPMEVFARPANIYVAGFIGAPSMNFCTGRLVGAGDEAALGFGAQVRLPGRFISASGNVTIGVRPEHLMLDPAGSPMTIDLIEPLGSECLVHGKLADDTAITMRLPGDRPAHDHLTISLPPSHLHVFDTESGVRLEAIS